MIAATTRAGWHANCSAFGKAALADDPGEIHMQDHRADSALGALEANLPHLRLRFTPDDFARELEEFQLDVLELADRFGGRAEVEARLSDMAQQFDLPETRYVQPSLLAR